MKSNLRYSLIVVLLLAAILSADDAQGQRGKGSIRGIAVDEVTHSPVKNANILLLGPNIGRQAVTGSDGVFTFGALPPGTYVFQATAENYLRWHVENADQDTGIGETIGFKLSDGQQKSDVKISLTPSASIRGRVVDQEGLAIRSCTVAAVRRQYSPYGHNTVGESGSVNTDVNGMYALFLPAGRYRLAVKCSMDARPPHAIMPGDDNSPSPPMLLTGQFYPGTTHVDDAKTFEVSAGAAVAGIDFRMRAEKTSNVVVRLRVPDLHSPTPEFEVDLRPADSSRNLLLDIRPQRVGPGVFRFWRVPAGSYFINAEAWDAKRSAVAAFGRVSIEVAGDGTTREVELTSPATFSVNGNVALQNQSSSGIRPGQLRISVGSDEFHYAAEAQVQNDGSFTLQGVHPGRWTVFPEMGRFYVTAVSFAGKQATATDFSINPGEHGTLKITLSDRMGTLSATVTGMPQSMKTVSLIVQRKGELKNRTIGAHVSGGRIIAQLRPGEYKVCVTGSPLFSQFNESPDAWDDLKASCPDVKIGEEGPTNITVPYISADTIRRILSFSRTR